MKLIKIKKEFEHWDKNHQHDYRWIKDRKEREDWIKNIGRLKNDRKEIEIS